MTYPCADASPVPMKLSKLVSNKGNWYLEMYHIYN